MHLPLQSIPTPYLALDYDALEHNISSLADYCKRNGIGLRPHFKAHKTAEIALLQLKAGASGISVATLGEALALFRAGISCPLLITSEQILDASRQALVEYLAKHLDLWLCVESRRGIEELAELPLTKPLNILLDIDIGTGRTGAPPNMAVELAERLARVSHLKFRGIQTYQGHPSNVECASKRRELVLRGWERAREVVERLRLAGLPPEVISGGNTSTFEYDLECGVLNELQLGGYVVGDLGYTRLERPPHVKDSGGGEVPNPALQWREALRVAATVVSNRQSGEFIVDAGLKAFATDRPYPPLLEGFGESSFQFDGDEFGRVRAEARENTPERGDRVAFRPPHCDPTVNLYRYLEVFKEGRPFGRWDVLGRHPLCTDLSELKGTSAGTICLRGGYTPPREMASQQVPIIPTVGYLLESAQQAADILSLKEEGFTYSRIANPTVDVFEKRVAELEGGGSAVALGSGMAAVSLALLNLLQAGDNFIATSTLYGGTMDTMMHTLGRFNIKARFVPVNGIEKIPELVDDHTRCVFVESLGNPLLDIPDFNRLSEICRSQSLPLIIDHTIATPYPVRVRDLEGDIAVYSGSKFLGGHGAAISGVVVDLGTYDWSRSSNPLFSHTDPSYGFAFGPTFKRQAMAARLRAVVLRNLGACLGPFNAWVMLQGLETLPLRMEAHSKSALAVARWLENHPAVSRVTYPGLTSHPYYARCHQYLGGAGGGLLFFSVKGGKSAAAAVIERCKLISHVTQLGDARTTIQHPATTSHSQLSEQELEKLGLGPEMLRLSVGLESLGDILEDLDQALNLRRRE